MTAGRSAGDTNSTTEHPTTSSTGRPRTSSQDSEAPTTRPQRDTRSRTSRSGASRRRLRTLSTARAKPACTSAVMSPTSAPTTVGPGPASMATSKRSQRTPPASCSPTTEPWRGCPSDSTCMTGCSCPARGRPSWRTRDHDGSCQVRPTTSGAAARRTSAAAASTEVTRPTLSCSSTPWPRAATMAATPEPSTGAATAAGARPASRGTPVGVDRSSADLGRTSGTREGSLTPAGSAPGGGALSTPGAASG